MLKHTAVIVKNVLKVFLNYFTYTYMYISLRSCVCAHARACSDFLHVNPTDSDRISLIFIQCVQ